MTRFALSILVLLTLSAPALAQKNSSLVKAAFPRLAYTDVGGEFGLASDPLPGFGVRVDNARRFADAQALAAEAVLLAYVEELAGKRAASVTALAILNEAVRIAEDRQDPVLEKALALAATRIPGGNEPLSRLRQTLAMAPRTRGEGTFIGYVRVVNQAGRLLDVYIDGKYMGFLHDAEEQTFSTGNGTTHVRVTDAFGNTAGEVVDVKQEDTFTWTIKP
ncbi:MAG: hypothetical protein HY962_02795 [Ignavibacteriae bacterium]|nr:hypothetical protein [Ignavibacteriota bacterium]